MAQLYNVRNEKIRQADAIDARERKRGVDKPFYANKFEILMKRTNC